MRALWRKASTLVGVQYALMLEYRAEILLWALAGVLPLVLMGIWMKASHEGFTQGRTPEDFARYFMSVFVIGQFTTVWVIYEFEYEVLEGRLSPYLLQPIDPVWRHLASHAGERLTRLPWVAGMVGLFFLLYPSAFWVPSLRSVFFTILAVAMAFVLRFTMQYTFAMLSFWIERSSAVEQFVFLLHIFLSGRIAPLEMYPAGMAELALYTPFPYIVYFPVRLLLDPTADPWPGLGMMVFWTAVFMVLNRLLWRRGLRRYSAMGA